MPANFTDSFGMQTQNLLYIFLPLLIFSCVRTGNPEESRSSVDFVAPKLRGEKLAGLGIADSQLPAGKKACFAVEVKGPGIASSSLSSCSPLLGLNTGFVDEGATLSLLVPKGDGRVFTLLMLVTDIGAACPSLNPAFAGTGAPFSSVYRVGQSAPINLSLANHDVSIGFSYLNGQQSVAATDSIPSCGTTTVVAPIAPALHGVLYSSGQVENSSGIPFDNPSDTLSSPALQSVWKVDVSQSNLIGFGSHNNGSVLSDPEAGSFNAPMFIGSISKKPDSGVFYGVDQSGIVYEVSSSSATALSGASCPFASCELPVWIQSISAGRGSNLYALDHSGNLYSVTSVGLSVTGVVVSPAVSQVIYY